MDSNPLYARYQAHLQMYQNGVRLEPSRRLIGTIELLTFLLFLEIDLSTPDGLRTDITADVLEWAPVHLSLPRHYFCRAYLSAVSVIHLFYSPDVDKRR